MPPTLRSPLTDVSPLNPALPVALNVQPTEAEVATSNLPLTDTSLSNVALEVNVLAPATLNVPLTDTLLLNIAAPSTAVSYTHLTLPTKRIV